MNVIAKDIIQSLETKIISKETDEWLVRWLCGNGHNNTDREILKDLALSHSFPTDKSNLFRGCRKLIDNKAESYSPSVYQASRFTGEDGFIIVIDLDCNCFDSFALTDYLAFLLDDVLYGNADNIYSDELVDAFETMSGEDEVIVVTDLSNSLILKPIERS